MLRIQRSPVIRQGQVATNPEVHHPGLNAWTAVQPGQCRQWGLVAVLLPAFSAALFADCTTAVMPNVNNKNIKAERHMLII